MADVQISEVDEKESTWGYSILCSDRSQSAKNFLMRPHLWKNEKYERRGLLKIKIHILFMETTHEPLH
jgi:hypothetical protein